VWLHGQNFPSNSFQTLHMYLFQTQIWLSEHVIKHAWWVLLLLNEGFNATFKNISVNQIFSKMQKIINWQVIIQNLKRHRSMNVCLYYYSVKLFFFMHTLQATSEHFHLSFFSRKWVHLCHIESEWLLFNANSAIFQLYHGGNKLIFNEMMMKSTLY
jgi:hypothetical protein